MNDQFQSFLNGLPCGRRRVHLGVNDGLVGEHHFPLLVHRLLHQIRSVNDAPVAMPMYTVASCKGVRSTGPCPMATSIVSAVYQRRSEGAGCCGMRPSTQDRR